MSTTIIRAQKKALEIIASFARNEAATAFLKLPADDWPGTIEMVRLPRAMFDAILTAAMDTIAQQSGGKRDTQQEVAAALLDADVPFPDKLVGRLMGYAGHWMEIEIAERLCFAFRGRSVSRLEDHEMTEYFQVQSYLENQRFVSRFHRKIGRMRHRL